jgi:hypothetical protein
MRNSPQGALKMESYHGLSPEERDRITDIQDLLIERYVEQKEALEEGKKVHAIEIGHDIEELRSKMEAIEELANA